MEPPSGTHGLCVALHEPTARRMGGEGDGELIRFGLTRFGRTRCLYVRPRQNMCTAIVSVERCQDADVPSRCRASGTPYSNG